TATARLVLREHYWAVEDGDTVGMLTINRKRAQGHRQMQGDLVAGLPGALNARPGARRRRHAAGLAVHRNRHFRTPAWDTKAQRERRRLIQYQTNRARLGFRKLRLLP